MEDVESFALRASLTNDELFARLLPDGASTDLIPERFVWRFVCAWDEVSLDERHALLERHLASVEADEHSFGLSFAVAFPETLYFSTLTEETVPVDAPRRTRLSR